MRAPARVSLDDAALGSLLQKIEREHGLALTGYKQPCLRRRLAVRMRARGVHTFAAYAELLDRLPDEYDLLLDALTIGVTRFFRNPETYELLAARVVPALLALGATRVWSAGCASGEEPYSLALLFAQAAGGKGEGAARGPAGLAGRVRIDATDLDPGALEAVRGATYGAPAVEQVPDALRRRFFSPGPPYRLDPVVAHLVTPLLHDLTAEPPPHPPYHLIVCRNVVIYFDRATQERVFAALAEALVSGGWLLLGKVETLLGPARERLVLEDARERLFRRP